MRHSHDLSHEHKTSFDMGYLVPAAAIQVLPGDTFIGSSALLARVAPQANPVMHDVDIRCHWWFVPNRILWSSWEDFITGASVQTHPTITIPASNYELLDYMGIPAAAATGVDVDALPVRAYNMIWNEFYRDQDLHTERSEDTTTLARICWEKDYFTTARSQPQQGDAVEIPFSTGTQAPIQWQENGTSDVNIVRDAGTADANLIVEETGSAFEDITAYADLSAITGGGISIDDLRQALAMQKIAEQRMRFGSRYVDQLRHFGVPGSMLDGRLDRPEYIGGGRQKVNFSEVLATAEGTSTDVGDMFGHGIAGLRTKRWRKMFPEHGWALCLLSARPKTLYQEGIPRKFLRSDPTDYWHPELEVMPWQSVPQIELYHGGSPTTTWGYVPKYDEYRHEQSYVSNSFRTGGTEADWHLGRVFGSVPTLNASFVECTPSDAIYSDTSMPEMICNIAHRIRAKRFVRATAQIGGNINL